MPQLSELRHSLFIVLFLCRLTRQPPQCISPLRVIAPHCRQMHALLLTSKNVLKTDNILTFGKDAKKIPSATKNHGKQHGEHIKPRNQRGISAIDIRFRHLLAAFLPRRRCLIGDMPTSSRRKADVISPIKQRLPRLFETEF